MSLDKIFEKIDRYQKRDSGFTLVVDLQNRDEVEALADRYATDGNEFLFASDEEFCRQDELPVFENLMDRVHHEERNFFVMEVSTFYSLKGKNALTQMLKEFLNKDIAGHAILISFQCSEQLNQIMDDDHRMRDRVCISDGEPSKRPRLVFAAKGVELAEGAVVVKGVNRIADAIESGHSDTIYVETAKGKQTYPDSCYAISDMKDPYDMLCRKDPATERLGRDFGAEDDWEHLLSKFNKYPSWESLIDGEIGNAHSLGDAIFKYGKKQSDKHWAWLYLAGLKLFGAGSDEYLGIASKTADSPAEFIRNIYRAILDVSPHSKDFPGLYARRKEILGDIGVQTAEVAEFCKIVRGKGKDAIYYLTDITVRERKLIFELLAEHGLEYGEDLYGILEMVYPDLHSYLKPYYFGNELLDSYFKDYKYQKVINQILPEFMETVEKQAVDRDYNSILPPRSSVIEKIDRTDAQAYFTDALGVEYLGFIMDKCSELSMLANVTVCRCELPSITSRNKEFFALFDSQEHPIRTVSDIDTTKHHRKTDDNYQKSEFPIHLIRELEIIEELLKNIQADLLNEKYSKAILISDHGASRLAVIYDKENFWEMAEKGKHSGRCCPKSDIDGQPESATDADDFWVLANYDRFKGSRKADVEAHGGATLEEVTVPIIELTYFSGDVEVRLMPIDGSKIFAEMPEITVDYKNPAAIKIYASKKLSNVSVEIDGHRYAAVAVGDNFHEVRSMPEIRQAKEYSVDVYACGNKIASSLPLKVKKRGMSENKNGIL